MKHINILIPASNIVAERELYQYIIQNNLDVALHFSRLTFKTPYGENQEQYTRELVESIPPAMHQLERIKAEKTAILCSSAALFYQGEEKFIFPLSCMVAELERANIKSPLVITPYNQAIGMRSIAELQKHQITPSKSIHLDIKNKEELFSYSAAKLANTIKQEINDRVDAICVLCTNFATAHIAKQVTTELNLPFLSSNLATIKYLTTR